MSADASLQIPFLFKSVPLNVSHFHPHDLADTEHCLSSEMAFFFLREREREKKVRGGGSERHYRLEGGVTET
jgi:hypothetical protein